MPIESGEPKKEDSIQKESARRAFETLTEALHEIEQTTPDLNKPSNEPWAPELRGLVDQKATLEITIDVLKEVIDYLDPKPRKQAEGMLIRAELYLAAHKPNREADV